MASAATYKVPTSVPSSRLDSVDLLRGLVMVIMALDHTRGYFANGPGDPTDFQKTTVAYFLTRWITHYCAPTFVFLAGTGAYLAGTRGKTKNELWWFLISRGLWIVLLELTVVKLSWMFSFKTEDWYGYGGGVLWAIGWSMVVLSFLIYLPTGVIALFGLIMIGGHNALDRVMAEDVGKFGWIWSILHSKQFLEIYPAVNGRPAITFMPQYPLIPWIGVMACGYGLGSILTLDRWRRRPILFVIGISLIAGFLALRYTNAYGDARPWTHEKDDVFTALSWLNCTKYPPSLLFLMMTLGPSITLLSLFDFDWGPIGKPLITFGRVPMFYYLLHIPLIHGLSKFADIVRGKLTGEDPPPHGFDLPWVYCFWLCIVLALYPLCVWFAGVKRRHKWGWLSYF